MCTIEGSDFNASLKFYYLLNQEDRKGYEQYYSGGYLGFTPSSHISEMGIFN